MKIGLSFVLISFLTMISAAVIDSVNQTTTDYSDGGFTRHYTIPRKIRKLTSILAYASGVMIVLGGLCFIWLS